ncbi:MAG: nuclease [Nitrospinota bacterium]|nr:MAG: nuclease [Nitrospinota bacterium]
MQKHCTLITGIGLTVFLLLPLPLFAATTFTGKVVGVIDGDTIEVLREGKAVRVRLAGIDAPERRQPYGRRAKQYTSALVFGQVVTVQVQSIGKYGRIIGNVLLSDGRNLSQELVRAGYAWWYRQYAPHDTTLQRLEREARLAQRGLWADPTPIPPWEYRKKAESFRKGSSSVPVAGPIIGNRRSKIYHWPGCPNYNRISPENRVVFSSRQEAEAAGYRAARNCR